MTGVASQLYYMSTVASFSLASVLLYSKDVFCDVAFINTLPTLATHRHKCLTPPTGAWRHLRTAPRAYVNLWQVFYKQKIIRSVVSTLQ